MINFYKVKNKNLVLIESFETDCIIELHNPTTTEITYISNLLDVNHSIITRILDQEEKSRIDIKKDYILSVINAPFKSDNNTLEVYPVGMLVFDTCLLLISMGNVSYIKNIDLIKNKELLLKNKIDMFISIFYEITKSYIAYTTNIIKSFESLENLLLKSSKKEYMLQILNLQKTLTFFSFSLHSNDLVIAKLIKLNEKKEDNYLSMFPRINDDLLGDVHNENKQAIEMADTYSKLIIDLMSTITSIISNEQNKFLKLLANITVLLTIPMILAGFWGMNVKVPYQEEAIGFWIVTISSLVFIALSLFFLWKKNLLD